MLRTEILKSAIDAANETLRANFTKNHLRAKIGTGFNSRDAYVFRGLVLASLRQFDSGLYSWSVCADIIGRPSPTSAMSLVRTAVSKLGQEVVEKIADDLRASRNESREFWLSMARQGRVQEVLVPREQKTVQENA